MTTEITDTIEKHARPLVLYDAECRFCQAALVRWGPKLHKRGFEFEPLQSPKAKRLSGLSENELREEMKIVFPDGKLVGGVDAMAVLLRRIASLACLGWLIPLPGFHWIGQKAYRWLARNRSCFGNVCQTTPPSETRPPHRGATTFLESP